MKISNTEKHERDEEWNAFLNLIKLIVVLAVSWVLLNIAWIASPVIIPLLEGFYRATHISITTILANLGLLILSLPFALLVIVCGLGILALNYICEKPINLTLLQERLVVLFFLLCVLLCGVGFVFIPLYPLPTETIAFSYDFESNLLEVRFEGLRSSTQYYFEIEYRFGSLSFDRDLESEKFNATASGSYLYQKNYTHRAPDPDSISIGLYFGSPFAPSWGRLLRAEALVNYES